MTEQPCGAAVDIAPPQSVSGASAPPPFHAPGHPPPPIAPPQTECTSKPMQVDYGVGYTPVPAPMEVDCASNAAVAQHTSPAFEEAAPKKKARRKSQPVATGEIGEDEAAFVVRATGEFFRSYTGYIDRVHQLRQRIWQCPATGKKGLTYEESLQSSSSLRKRLASFPDELVPALLSAVHHNTERLSNIVDTLHKHFDARVTKSLLRLKIKDCATRMVCVGAPWIVSDELVAKHELPTQLPDDLQELVNAHKSGQPIKRRKPALAKKADVDSEHKAKKSKTESSPPRRPPVVKYPMEDSLLEGFADIDIPNREDAPEWAQDDEFEVFSYVYMTWHFLNRFSEELRLSSFGLDLWLESLEASSPNNLLEEAIMCLLEVLRQGSEHGSRLGRNPIDSFNYDHLLSVLESVNDEYETFDLKIGGSLLESLVGSTRQFFELEAPVKVRMVQLLCDLVMRCDVIRSRLDADLTRRQELKTSLRAQQAEDRKEIRDQRKVLKEEKLKMVESSKVKNAESPATNSTENDIGSEPLQEAGDFASTVVPQTQTRKTKTSVGKAKGVRKTSESKLEGSKLLDLSASKNTSLVKLSRQEILTERRRQREIEEQERRVELERQRAEAKIQSQLNRCDLEEKKRGHDRERLFAEDMAGLSIRVAPIGLDRHRRSYYWLPGMDGRLVVVCPVTKRWGWFVRSENITEILAVFNDKGVREKALMHRLGLLQGAIATEMKQHEQKLLRALRSRQQPKRRTRSRAKGLAATDFDQNEDDLAYVNLYRIVTDED